MCMNRIMNKKNRKKFVIDFDTYIYVDLHHKNVKRYSYAIKIYFDNLNFDLKIKIPFNNSLLSHIYFLIRREHLSTNN